MLEVVEVGHVLRGKDATTNLLGGIAGKLEVDGLVLVKTDVGDGENDRAVLGLSSRGRKQWAGTITCILGTFLLFEVGLADGHDVALQVDGQIGSFLKRSVHLEDVIGWREHHVTCTFLVSEYHRLQHVDNLCDVGHLDTVSVFVEHIE